MSDEGLGIAAVGFQHFEAAMAGHLGDLDPHDLARIIHNTDARFLDRHVESSKIVYAALLLLMLGAASADLVSPSA